MHPPLPAPFVRQFYGPSQETDPNDIPRIVTTWSSSVGVRNLMHWSQMYHKASGLYFYDFGPDVRGAMACNQHRQQGAVNGVCAHLSNPIFRIEQSATIYLLLLSACDSLTPFHSVTTAAAARCHPPPSATSTVKLTRRAPF